MNEATKRLWRDRIERVLATAAQAGIAEVIVVSADWPQWVVIPLATAAAAAKAWLAKYTGRSDSASLDPKV